MGSFEGKVIAIIEAGSGIGQATAQLLAAQGASLSLADIGEWDLEDTLQSLDHQERHLLADVEVSESENLDRWIQRTVQHFGRLDGAVNVLRLSSPYAPITEFDDDWWDCDFGDVARDFFYYMRAQLRMMDAGASIVSVPSAHGQFGLENAALSSSRAVVIALTRTAAIENPDIRVNCVSPGYVGPPIDENEEQVTRDLQRTVQQRRGQLVEVANVIAFLLSDAASFVTGAVYHVDGGQVG